MAIILGLDPGLATVGFGVIRQDKKGTHFVDCGVIKTPAGLELGERLSIIKKDLEDLLALFRPVAVGLEELFFAKNVTNALQVAHARGILLQSLHAHGIPVYPFTPMQVKNNIAGTGGAQKWQMQEMVRRLLKLPRVPKPDDAADALALALCAERVMKSQIP